MTPIQEYRKWLETKIKNLKLSTAFPMEAAVRDQTVHSIIATESALRTFNRIFPEDTQTLSDHLDKIAEMQEPTLQQKVDMMQGNLTDYPDETDNIYPKTQPHSFPPRD